MSRVALNPGLGGVRDVASAIISWTDSIQSFEAGYSVIDIIEHASCKHQVDAKTMITVKTSAVFLKKTQRLNKAYKDDTSSVSKKEA